MGVFVQCGMWGYSHVNLGVVMARRTVEAEAARHRRRDPRRARGTRYLAGGSRAGKRLRPVLPPPAGGLQKKVYITRLLGTLKSLGITISVTIEYRRSCRRGSPL